MALRAAIELPLPRLAEVFAAAFEAYFVPISAEVGPFAMRLRAEHVDLAASLVAWDGDAPVGLALVARRGSSARIAAMGVVAAARNRGLGRVLLDAAVEQARARGERRMILEVIEENAPARALYERNGFTLVRRLVGFRAPPLGGPANEGEHAALEERPVEELVRMYVAEADPALPWQLAPATIAAAAPPTRAFALGSAVALVDLVRGALVVRALVVPAHDRRQGHATRLVHALRARFSDRALRIVSIVPEGLLGQLPARVGAETDPLTQLELVREL
ncbi:MAG TPA: GNAT family N-acetyltransferase [Kofleriaceae bacterium]|nr:GNAT family N-acetyltransferase [Kofleriaceae bacterium]